MQPPARRCLLTALAAALAFACLASAGCATELGESSTPPAPPATVDASAVVPPRAL
jgi:hypothetical protein